jgi:hypothetical protein
MKYLKLPGTASMWPTEWARHALMIGLGTLLALGSVRGDEPPAPTPAVASQCSKSQQQKKNLDGSTEDKKPAATSSEKVQEQPATDEAMRKIINDYLKEQQAATTATEQGAPIFSKANLQGYLDNNGCPWLTNPNRDFTLHTGCWVQYDSVWFNQKGRGR